MILAAIALTTAAPAQADMQLGHQDDEACKYQTAGQLERADSVGASWVRLMVPDNRWPAEAAAIVACAAAHHAAGRRVLVSLVAHDSHPTPAQWETFTAQVVAHLAPVVDAWSPMNEPTYPGTAAWTPTACVVRSSPSVGARTLMRKVRGWKKVRRRKATHRRVVKRHANRTVVRFKRAHGKRARWKRTVKRQPRKVVFLAGSEQHECETASMIRAYRNVWDRTAPVIAAADPTARLVLGDVYTDPIEFMRGFYEPGQPDIRPDVMGTHYTCPCAMAAYVDAARARGLELWETEWGLGQHGGDTSPEAWVRTLRQFEAAGVRATFIYDVADATWDTRMRPVTVDAVAANR